MSKWFMVAIALLGLPTTVNSAQPATSSTEAELKLLRATVKRQNEKLQPLRAKLKAQESQIRFLTDELEPLKQASREAAALKEQVKRVSEELASLKQTLAARDNQLNEMAARLRARAGASGETAGGVSEDPVKAEFVASFQRFSRDLEPAFRKAFDDVVARFAKDGLRGRINNLTFDVVATNSAVSPLLGVVTASCSESSAHFSDVYSSTRFETYVLTMRFSRDQGRWKLLDATRRATEVRGRDTLGKVYDKDGGAETDYSQSLVVRAAVAAANGLLPPDAAARELGEKAAKTKPKSVPLTPVAPAE